ncbi:unnamed protein product [Heligmosomoides polygyrus]|uniref:Uncharacterized protein n=1 Tax=Heligmosomoides polygyrus TaxID=6339 RepID=A0A183G2A0_HELPZ|nr:unnamed protein product [Heligmosomoides polygyrus]
MVSAALAAVGSSTQPTRRHSVTSNGQRRYSWAQLVFGDSALIRRNSIPPKEWYSSDEELEGSVAGWCLAKD